MVKKHFVEFYSPGSFFAETDTKAIDSWDIEKAKEMAKEIIQRYGAKPYAFRFITRGRTDDELDSKVIEQSGYHFINGTIKTLAEIKAENNPECTTFACISRNFSADRFIRTSLRVKRLLTKSKKKQKPSFCKSVKRKEKTI